MTPARSAVHVYDFVARWRGWPIRAADAYVPMDSDVATDPTPMAGGHGLLVPGEVTLLAGPSAHATALAFDLACDVAVRATELRPPSGVLISTRDAPDLVVQRMTHALARLPLHSTAKVKDLEHAACVLSQLPIWIEQPLAASAGDAVERMRRPTCGVPVRLRVITEVPLVSKAAAPRASIVMDMKMLASRTSSAVLLIMEGRDEAAWPLADTCVELTVDEGEVRPRVVQGSRAGELLPLRLAHGWCGFEELPDPDADFIAEPFYDPATR